MNDCVLELKNIKKYYGKTRGIENVSFKLQRGDIYGFIGPNGAGKSTTIRSIMGLLNYSEGNIYFNGITLDSNEPSIKEKIGYLPSEINLYGEMKDMI